MLALNPWLILGASLVVAAALTGAYVKGRSDGRALEVAERAIMEEVARVSREAAMEGAAEKIAEIDIVNKTIYARATREVVEKVVYRDCVHSDDGLRAINEALTPSGAKPTGNSVVPGADTASR